MSVTRTAEGTWRARIRDANGKQISKTFGFKADALAWEREKLLLRDKGDRTRAWAGTVAQWADSWLELSRDLAPGTVRTYRRDLHTYILPSLGDFKLADLTPEAIDEFLSDELARGLAPSTVHRHYRTIRRFCQVAVERQRIPANPCQAVRPPRIPHREMRYLTVPELELLADTIGDRYRAWVLVAGYGGLRWGEMLALRPQDLQGDTLDVNGQLMLEDGEWVRVPPKTRAGRRKVVLPASVAEELRYHIERYAKATIFVNQNDQPLNHTSFANNVFKRALVKARLDRQLRIHDLRHTCVAIAIQAGAHPKTIQARLGHASISITLDTYGHLMPDIQSTVAEDMDRLRQQRADEM